MVPPAIASRRLPDLTHRGLPLVDNAAVGETCETCARLGRCSFFVTLGPIRISDGTGAPVNPQAIF